MTFESFFDTKCFPKEAFVSLLFLLLHAKKARQSECVAMDPVRLLPFVDGTSISTDPAPRWSQFLATQTVDLGCNPVESVQSVAFCDGTTMGPGNSFDIKAAAPLVLEGTPDENYEGAPLVMNGRVLQQAQAQEGFVSLDKAQMPLVDPQSAGAFAVSQWTTRAIGSRVWRNICWSPTLRIFVAVAENATTQIGTSSDGINWTLQNVNNVGNIESVCWSADTAQFVAVLSTGTNRVLRSLDGVSWSQVSVPLEEWFSVTWSPQLSLFVALARGTNGGSKIMTSANGSVWTTRATPALNNWNGICWSPELGLFVAVGDTGAQQVMTSTNGVDWTLRTAPASNWFGVVWSPQLSLFVATAFGGTDRVMYSANGTEWTVGTIQGTPAAYRGVVWAAELGIFVAIGLTSSQDGVLWSSDGKMWRVVVGSGVLQDGYRGIAWSPELGMFCAVSTNNTGMTSRLNGRFPTASNVFGSAFNSINGVGMWTIPSLSRSAPVTISAASLTVQPGQNWLIGSFAGTMTITLPIAAQWPGLEIMVKNTVAQLVVSASSNVVPIGSSTAGTVILPATAGSWCTMVSDGANWVIMKQ